MAVRLDPQDCRARMAAARVAHLATATSVSGPHVVPVTFALDHDVISFAVDQKPKTTMGLRRLSNIRTDPRVAVLCDHYVDDWTHLWWARADGLASIVTDSQEREAVIAALSAKYPQYRADPPRGPVVAITVRRWSGWAFTP